MRGRYICVRSSLYCEHAVSFREREETTSSDVVLNSRMIQQLCRILFILYCERTGRRVRPNVLTRRRVRTFVSERVDAFVQMC